MRKESVQDFYASESTPKVKLGTVSTHAQNWPKMASRIVIWEYPLGDYDADINAMLAVFTRSDVENLELFVINAYQSAFERAVALAGLTNATFYNEAKKSLMKLHI